MDKKQMVIIGVVILMALLIKFQEPIKDSIMVIPGRWDISSTAKEAGLEEYLKEDMDFDYTSPEVYAVAQEIKAKARNEEEAIKETLLFVVRNVRYSSAITISYCYQEKASDVLNSGLGDCVSMSRLVTALLRAQGIPARTAGGCLASFKRCVSVFAVIPTIEAQTTEMMEGDFKKRGFLHRRIKC